MEQRGKDTLQQPATSTVNCISAKKQLDDLYSLRSKFRDPIKESEARIKEFQSELIRKNIGTGAQPQITVAHPHHTISESDLPGSRRSNGKEFMTSGYASD